METGKSKVEKHETGGNPNRQVFFYFFFPHNSTAHTQKMCLLGAVGEQEEPSGASGQLETPFSKWCFAPGRFSVTNYDFF